MQVHKVKSWPWFFNAIKDGWKTHDLRKDDRNYNVGDQLILQEFDPRIGCYTNQECTVEITYITSQQFPCAFSSAALASGYSILSIRLIKHRAEEHDGPFIKK